MLPILIKTWLKLLCSKRRCLFKNKMYYLDKICFYFCYFTEHNIKMRHNLGWSNKKCGSFLKYVVLVQKPWLTSSTSRGVLLQCLQTAKLLISSSRRIGEIFCSDYWQNPPVTAADHYFHYISHHQNPYHHFRCNL